MGDSEVHVPATAETPLPPGNDLITDAELRVTSDDEFQAKHIVAEIASVIESHEPGKPANIALYGPWGSGKSSIARLLANEYDPDHPQRLHGRDSDRTTRFVRFDAFKYAGHSLHRNFLLKVAAGLDGKVDFKERLYSSVTARRVRLSPRDAVTVARQALLFVVLPTIAVAVLGAMVWAFWFNELPFREGTREVLPAALALLSVPAAAGLFGLLREVLPSSVVTASPSSEEQFEDEFEKLVQDSEADRVVIFVDEIDRCAPTEVVETLDTIRTFLDVPNCVVVVAADQRVLERALSERVRQTTPDDTTNPYYSAGSAYLDKVFHYQFSIPPLLPSVISTYALKLVEDKGGVWAAVDRENVISVLIPTHVRSPRRVKALLNNFVLTYRLALDRNVSATSVKTLADRAAELAVLVCLRSEFPLFAQDLPQHPALPRLVRWLKNDESLQAEEHEQRQEGDSFGHQETDPRPQATKATWERASQYFEGEVATDVALSAVDIERRARNTTPSPAIVRAMRDDLVGYLSKTAYVPSPATDLIYLADSSGFYGLEVDTAEELASLAHNAERHDLRQAVSNLDSDAQIAALRLLAHRTREYAVGEDGSNMASSLLVAAEAASDATLAVAVDEIARAVEQQQKRNRLRRADLSGALVVGLRSTWVGADGLVRAVMESGAYETDPGLAVRIVRHSTALRHAYADEVFSATGWAILHDREAFVDVLLQVLDRDDAAALLRDGASTISRVASRVLVPTDSPPDIATLVPDVARSSVAAVLDRLLSESDQRFAEHLAVALLASDSVGPASDLVAERAKEFSKASTTEFAASAGTAAVERGWREVETWVTIATTDVNPPDARRQVADDLTGKMWTEREQADVAPDEFIAALDALSVLAPGAADDRAELTRDLIAAEFENSAPDSANVERMGVEFEHVQRFVQRGLFHPPTAGNTVASALAAALRDQMPVPRQGRRAPSTDSQQAWAEDWSRRASDWADENHLTTLREAAMTSEWLLPPRRELVAIRLAVASETNSPYDLDQLVALTQQHADDRILGLAIESWLTSFAVEPSDVWVLARAHFNGDIPEPIGHAIAAWSMQAKKQERTDAIIPALAVLPSARPHVGYLEAVRAADADHRRLGAEIVRLCEGIRRWNPDLRKNVLDTWRQLAVNDRKARTVLLRSIGLRFINSGHTAAIEFLSYEDLLSRPPDAVREELRDALRAATAGRAKENAVAELLDRTGIERRSRVDKMLDKPTRWLRKS